MSQLSKHGGKKSPDNDNRKCKPRLGGRGSRNWQSNYDRNSNGLGAGEQASNATESPSAKKQWMTHVEREVLHDARFSCGARLLYAILRGYQGKNCAEPFPSLPTLVRHIGHVRKIVQKYLRELNEANLIESIPRRKSGQFCSNAYRIIGPSSRGKSVTTLKVPPQGKNTGEQKPRSEDNGRVESALLRNPNIKDSHSLKESQRESEEPFASLAEAVTTLQPEYPWLCVRDSLRKMVQKEGWSLTPSNCRGWLAIEKASRRKKKWSPEPEHREHREPSIVWTKPMPGADYELPAQEHAVIQPMSPPIQVLEKAMEASPPPVEIRERGYVIDGGPFMEATQATKFAADNLGAIKTMKPAFRDKNGVVTLA